MTHTKSTRYIGKNDYAAVVDGAEIGFSDTAFGAEIIANDYVSAQIELAARAADGAEGATAMKKQRHFYAIAYAYGRDVINNGIRADQVHRFPTKAARIAFVHANDGKPFAVDSIAAKDTRVQAANRYAAQGLEWPIAVL